jgi:hypothetical protein
MKHVFCYGLDLKYPPKLTCWRLGSQCSSTQRLEVAGSSRLWPHQWNNPSTHSKLNGVLGGDRNFRKWGLVRESRSWGEGMPMKGIFCLQLLRIASWPSGGEQLCSIMGSLPWCSASSLGQKPYSPGTKDWNLWNHEPQSFFPVLSRFSQLFYDEGKLTNIYLIQCLE